jgi:hypothetical protein
MFRNAQVPVLVAREIAAYGISIDHVNLRDVSKYRDGVDGKCYLSISKFQGTEITSSFPPRGPLEEAEVRQISMKPSSHPPKSGNPNIWYEVSFSSIRGEEFLKENRTLEFGCEAGWSAAQMNSEGILTDLASCALGMICKMNVIGSSNAEVFYDPKCVEEQVEDGGDAVEGKSQPRSATMNESASAFDMTSASDAFAPSASILNVRYDYW